MLLLLSLDKVVTPWSHAFTLLASYAPLHDLLLLLVLLMILLVLLGLFLDIVSLCRTLRVKREWYALLGRCLLVDFGLKRLGVPSRGSSLTSPLI